MKTFSKFSPIFVMDCIYQISWNIFKNLVTEAKEEDKNYLNIYGKPINKVMSYIKTMFTDDENSINKSL